MILSAFIAGLVTGIVATVAALFVLRSELDLASRVTGRTIDFTHRSRS